MAEKDDTTVPNKYGLIEFKNRNEPNIFEPLDIISITRKDNFSEVTFRDRNNELKTVTMMWFFTKLDPDVFLKPNRKDILNMNDIRNYSVFNYNVVIMLTDCNRFGMSLDNIDGLVKLQSFLPAIPRCLT